MKTLLKILAAVKGALANTVKLTVKLMSVSTTALKEHTPAPVKSAVSIISDVTLFGLLMIVVLNPTKVIVAANGIVVIEMLNLLLRRDYIHSNFTFRFWSL